MFDQFEAKAPLQKKDFEAQALALRQQLLQTQFALEDTPHPVIIVIAGLDGAGKGVLVHRLNEWMDPRGIETNTYWEHSDEEESRPYFWRYWQKLPPRGRMGIFLGSWYTQATQQRLEGSISEQEFQQACERICTFERQLSDDGAIILKLWLHVSEETQRRQLEEKAPRRQQNPRITDHPYELTGNYTPAMVISEELIRSTQTFLCPWHIIDSEDRYYRDIKAGEIIRDTIARRLQGLEVSQKPPPLPVARDFLATVPLEKALDKDDYKQKLRKY